MQLAAQDRRAVIEDLLDIQIFSLMNKLAKTKLSSLMNERVANKALIDAATEKITMQERYIKEIQQDAESLAREYRKERDHNFQEVDRLNKEIMIHGQAVMDLNLTITDKKKVQGTIKKATQLEAQLESALSKHKKTIKFYETEEKCPTCIQVIDGTFKANQLSEVGSKIHECEVGMQEMEKKITDAQDRLTEIEKIERTIADHELVVAQHLTSVKEIEKFNTKLNEKISNLKQNHQSTEREQMRLLEHQQELNKLEEVRKELIESAAYYDAAGTLLKDTGIKTKIIRQYLPIINTLVNKYLATMDFFVNFNLDDTFKESIKSRHRDEFTYHSFSEGEKQRIDMALMLTWRAVAKLKNSADTNILILDEVFDSSLDNAGAEELMKILHGLDATNVFVISHRGDILQDKFSNVIRFQTQQNFSRIVP
jgi:DNA repair exonuclease SbcCD ATPase subunit